MPNLKSEIADVTVKKFFATMDFYNAYWKIPLEKYSKDTCGIIAPQGVFTAMGGPYGLITAVAHLQAQVCKCLQDMQNAFKLWLDDFIIYLEDVKCLLKHLESF